MNLVGGDHRSVRKGRHIAPIQTFRLEEYDTIEAEQYRARKANEKPKKKIYESHCDIDPIQRDKLKRILGYD